MRPSCRRATMPPMVEPPKGWHRVCVVAGSLGPLGHLPASGTVTVAVVGVPVFWLVQSWSAPTFVVVTLAFTGASVWLHAAGDRILGEKDSRRLVWDEIVGFLFAIAFVPFTWQIALLAFLLERFLDIVKVPPANWIERRWPGGWGVVGDDVVAGLYTCALLHLAIQMMPRWLGILP